MREGATSTREYRVAWQYLNLCCLRPRNLYTPCCRLDVCQLWPRFRLSGSVDAGNIPWHVSNIITVQAKKWNLWLRPPHIVYQAGTGRGKGGLWKGWHIVVSTISFPKCWKHAYQGDRSAKRTATPSEIVRNVKICNIFWHFSIKCDVFCFLLSAFSRKFLSVHSLCMCRQKETDKLTYIMKITETTEISCVAFLARDKHEFYLL